MSHDFTELQDAHAASFRAVAAASGSEVFESGGWLLYDSHTGIDALNTAIVVGSGAQPSLDAARDWFSPRGSGYRLLLRDPQDGPSLAAAMAARYGHERRQPVMTRALPLEDWPAREAVRFENVCDASGAHQFLAVRQDRPAHHPPDATEAPFIERLAQSGAFRYLVATRGGSPIATATAFATGGVVIVSNVFVAPQERRHGLGAAITAAAFASFPGTVAMLEASRMGEPLYRRMGFNTVYYHVRLRPPATVSS